MIDYDLDDRGLIACTPTHLNWHSASYPVNMSFLGIYLDSVCEAYHSLSSNDDHEFVWLFTAVSFRIFYLWYLITDTVTK
jgi:hypothetical protein